MNCMLIDLNRYIVAKMMKYAIGCSNNSLRALNVAATCLICFVSYDILRLLRISSVQLLDKSKAENDARAAKHDRKDSTVLLDANTALNIALFPPLFFFSALFYTDVMSTLVVLLSYNVFLNKHIAPRDFFDSLMTILTGVVALLFRQTNIFWVAVFPAALAVTAALKAEAPYEKSSRPANVNEVLRKSWKDGTVHDCPVQDASVLGRRNQLPRLLRVGADR